MVDHPMDNVPIRKMRFDFDSVENHDPVWSRSNPEFSIFINALGIHVPYFERFLVKTMRAYRDEVTDPELLDDVKGIIGQESHHAFNFERWTKVLYERYPGLPGIDQAAKDYFEKTFAEKSKKFRVGFTAGYETFTFLGGIIILRRYEELMADADPVIRAMWVWHQVEEVEHGSVAFDFYKAFYPDDEWYRRWMVMFAYGHIVVETFKAFAEMIRREGYYSSPTRAIKAWWFFAKFGLELGFSALPVLSKRYHPKKHPSSASDRNPVAMAWKAFDAAGHDLHQLKDETMKEMLTTS